MDILIRIGRAISDSAFIRRKELHKILKQKSCNILYQQHWLKFQIVSSIRGKNIETDIWKEIPGYEELTPRSTGLSPLLDANNSMSDP